MDISTLTKDQQQSVMCLDKPLIICAGAGSGKTFTLAQRIAYAFLPHEGNPPAVSDIDEVLAITFTDKAAAEIKHRVKGVLRAEGLNDQALKVDGAWISTIHGMCSRILHTHALELGIDPKFKVISDADRKDLLKQAINKVVASGDVSFANKYDVLFEQFAPVGGAFSKNNVSALVEALLNKAVALRHGVKDMCLSEKAFELYSSLDGLRPLYAEALAALEAGNQTDTALKNQAIAKEAMEAIDDFLEKSTFSVAEAREHIEEINAVLNKCGNLNKNCKAEIKERIIALDDELYRVLSEYAHWLAVPALKDLLQLSQEVEEEFSQMKRERGVLDNDDLLRKTIDAFDAYPHIAQRYEGKFRLVMVDEFQDTAQLQIDMIYRLAGPACVHLCTVGDAQQSIYRFRGADVNVYNRHKTQMAGDFAAEKHELKINFRSHEDILAFARRCFTQSPLQSEAFMDLSYSNKRSDGYKAQQEPRVKVVAVTPAGCAVKTNMLAVRQAGAQEIAKHFATLHQQGHSLGDMVVLLGAMSNVDLYADALRQAGLPCVVAGGSTFGKAPEVTLIQNLLLSLGNPRNSQALFAVLQGLFNVPDADLLGLSDVEASKSSSESTDDQQQAGQTDMTPVAVPALSKNFLRLVESLDNEGNSNLCASAPLLCVVRVYKNAWEASKTLSASQVVCKVVAESGWLVRLQSGQAQDFASAANVLKALRQVKNLDNSACGSFTTVAEAFDAYVNAVPHEAPGALSGENGEAVRLMTIHSSKGLEFPIVAVAEFEWEDKTGKEYLLDETICGKNFVSLRLGSQESGTDSYAWTEILKKLEPSEEPSYKMLESAAASVDVNRELSKYSSADVYAALKAYLVEQEQQEKGRLFYVAITRPRESVMVVAGTSSWPQKNAMPKYGLIADAIRQALCGEEDFPASDVALGYGGTQPLSFVRCLLSESADPANVVSTLPSQMFVPDYVKPQPGLRAYSATSREGTYSYSSIAPSHDSAEDKRGRSAVEADAQSDLAQAVATNFGSALHKCAEIEALCAGKELSRSKVEQVARDYVLGAEAEERLWQAYQRWVQSSARKESLGYTTRIPEMPFQVRVEDEHLEGEIDLICWNQAPDQGGEVFVVDYKTGGSSDETPEALREKHDLQARCYAYAVLLQGAVCVDLRFVRVERASSVSGEPQVVCYHFDRNEMEALRAGIAQARLDKVSKEWAK